MKKLGEFYTDFSRIDLDTRGGFARVAQVKTNGHDGHPQNCAFKLMRHEIDYHEGLGRFVDETSMLTTINGDKNSPIAVTKIYDSGFVPIELSKSLQQGIEPSSDLEIITTGRDISLFLKEKNKQESSKWLPYILVELAAYDESLLRQIRRESTNDNARLHRLPTGEVLVMAMQLLDVMDYLHSKHHRAYMDWKPEHIFWDGLDRQVKLIDWNVTTPLDTEPGIAQNIRDDLRLFCGAVLYISLTFNDPENPSKPIGTRPTTDISSPISQIRKRYWTDNPNFYLTGMMLDENIKKIITKGLDPKQGFSSIQELRDILNTYSKNELGIENGILHHNAATTSPYLAALSKMRSAQSDLLQAQQLLIEAITLHGESLEFNRTFDVIKKALMNFPAS